MPRQFESPLVLVLAVAALERRLALRARVLRDGAETLVPADHVVPGDIVLLAAGNLVPADGVENLQTSPGLVSPPVWFRRLPLPGSSSAA